MRISDWSSDVCSSDLLRFDVVASSLADDVKARLLERSDRRITSDGVIVIKAQQHRKQEQNLDAALERLRLLIAAAEPAPRVRRATRPSKRSEEHTSELQSLMRISYAVFCLKKKRHHQLN